MNIIFLTISLLPGVLFILLGSILWKNPPKKINSLLGYRTQASMSSQAKWDFAQVYSSKLMVQVGIVLALVGILGQFVDVSDKLALSISIFSMVFGLITMIVMTETKLKNIK